MRSHLIQAASWAPTMGHKDACLEAVMDHQDWDDNTAVRWPEPGAVIQNGAVGVEQPVAHQ